MEAAFDSDFQRSTHELRAMSRFSRRPNARAKKPRRGRIAGKAKRRAALEAARKAADPEGWRRSVHNILCFPRVCPHKRCKRARACAGDARACFRRWWPVVPEAFKVEFRTIIKALHDGASPAEAGRMAAAEVARWRAMEARFAEQEARRHAPVAVERKPAPQPRIRMM
jgi:hypothetical protein